MIIGHLSYMQKNPTIALIVAAGSSSRYGADVPKPYINLMDRPVLAHVLATFTEHPDIDGVRVVISREHHPLYKKAAQGFSKLFTPVVGGDRRQDSVRIGLEAIARVGPGKVLIHDAARPLVDTALIDRVLDGLADSPAALPYTPVTDTIRHLQSPPPLAGGAGGGHGHPTSLSMDLSSPQCPPLRTRVSVRPPASGGGMILLDRSQLIAAQTPQGFDFDHILTAHRQFVDQDVTDDIALAELAGLDVTLVEGSTRNMKLTTQEQFVMMERMMAHTTTPTQASTETRTGSGFDVHAFENGEGELALCGIRIPHTQTLKGHSDADVGLHALVDALLGAIAEGDIGQHFPPNDARWKGADSRLFVQHALALLAKKGGQVTHVDLTIIGEAPKIAPHREAMRQQLAGLLQLDVRRVSVKATTTEQLGFLGRKEGLAAQAVVTVKLPE